ncbi:biotin--protein ligase 1, chloroplastic-like isoform X2 [Rutidosis leptorrhynchoides]
MPGLPVVAGIQTQMGTFRSRNYRILVEDIMLSPKNDAFNINAYMSSLSATCFGRVLLWSPRLHLTQDIVSLNFCEIPVGSVCIANIQFKGRDSCSNDKASYLVSINSGSRMWSCSLW